MTSLSVQSNIAHVMKQFRGMSKKVVKKAVVTALNKVGKEANTEAKRQLANKAGLKKKTVASNMKITKANKNNLSVLISIGGRQLNLVEFGARETKKGVSSNAWGKRTVNRGAFFFQGRKSGKKLVGKRGKGTVTGKRGTPIKNRSVEGVYGAHVPTEYFRGGVDKILEAKIASRFNKLLATALDYQFSRALKGDKVLGRFVK